MEKGNLECSQYSKLILNDQGCPSYPIRINLVILAFLDLHIFCFLHFFMSPLIKSVNRGMLVFITFRSEYVVHSTNEKLVYFFWWYSILKHLNETDIWFNSQRKVIGKINSCQNSKKKVKGPHNSWTLIKKRSIVHSSHLTMEPCIRTLCP